MERRKIESIAPHFERRFDLCDVASPSRQKCKRARDLVDKLRHRHAQRVAIT